MESVAFFGASGDPYSKSDVNIGTETYAVYLNFM